MHDGRHSLSTMGGNAAYEGIARHWLTNLMAQGSGM